MSPNKQEDQLYQFLVRSFLNGQKEALGELMRLLYNDLYAYGLSLTKDPTLTKDAIQNVFFDLWRKRENLPPIKKVKAYLLTCLRREIQKILVKEQQKRNTTEERSGPVVHSSVEEKMIREQNREERLLQLSQVLDLLSPKHREVIHLKFFEGMDSEEISQIMSIRLQSVYNLLSEALKSIRQKMISLVPALFTWLLFW